MKKYLIFILAIPISFIGGYCTSILIPQQNKIDILEPCITMEVT